MKKFMKKVMQEGSFIGFSLLFILTFSGLETTEVLFTTGVVLVTFVATRVYSEISYIMLKRKKKEEREFKKDYKKKNFKKGDKREKKGA